MNMFSWKKQNPPSQRQQSPATSDYSDLIAQGLRLAQDDNDLGGGDEYMAEDGDEDMGDLDLDDPELLAELQGLTGEVTLTKPRPSAGLTQPPLKAPVPKPQPQQPTPSAISRPAPISGPKQATPVAAAVSDNTTLTGLGVDLQGIMEDGDDEDVELTEDDWNDPQLMAQLQSFGGKMELDRKPQEAPRSGSSEQASMDVDTSKTTNPPASQPIPAREPFSNPLESTELESAVPVPVPTPPAVARKQSSSSSSMIAIPPRDQAFDDGESLFAEAAAPAPELIPPKRKEEAPKKNDKNLLALLKTRDAQYKRAALDANRSGDKKLAAERVKIFKSLQAWIRLVEAGGVLDLELYPVPGEPSTATPTDTTSASSPSTPQASSAPSSKPTPPTATKPFSPTIVSSATEATTFVSHGITEPANPVSHSIAEASGEDLRSGLTTRGSIPGGIEFRQLAADDDFQIVSNSDEDTYEMLESQLKSQIEMCTTTSAHYYQGGVIQTAIEFNKLKKIFKADLTSLQSYREHGRKAPAFHFQDVRFEVEVGFYKDIGLNELSFEIIRAWDLNHKDVQANDIDAYISWDLGWPTENMPNAGSGKGNTPVVKKTAKPDFAYTKTLSIDRTRAFQRFVERRKATLEVWHYRGLLWKSYLLGKTQVPLLALLNHSEVHEICQIIDPTTRKNTGGKVEIRIRLQRPLLKPEIVLKEEKWLVIDEFNSGGLGFPSPIIATPPSRSSAAASPGSRTVTAAPTRAVGRTLAAAVSSPVARTAPVTGGAPASPRAVRTQQQPATQTAPSTSTAPVAAQAPHVAAAPTVTNPKVATPSAVVPKPTAPAAVEEETEEEKALSELNSVELLVSNMVLENEIQVTQQAIQSAKASANSEGAEEQQDRLTQLEIKMKLLVLQVQTGQLTMDGYCQAVNARSEKDKQLAITLKKLNLKVEAMRALSRYKIMVAEMKEVEEAMAAQAEEEDEEEE